MVGHFLRLVEEVKLRAHGCQLQNEDVYMNTTFQDFIQMCVRKLRGEDGDEELVVDYVSAATRPPRSAASADARPSLGFSPVCDWLRWRRTSTT